MAGKKKSTLIGDCSTCTLSAMCLPIGPARLSMMLWLCPGCKNVFIGHYVSTLRADVVNVNEDCVALMTPLLGKRNDLMRCFECRSDRSKSVIHGRKVTIKRTMR